MIRPLILAALAATVAVLGWLALGRGPGLTVTDALAVPADGRAGVWRLTLTMESEGPPDRLLGLLGGEATLVGLEGPGLALIVPGGGTAQLAMEGAHGIMLRREAPGSLVPLTLLFERAGEVAARVRLSDAPVPAHGTMEGRAEVPAPTLRLAVPAGVSTEGFTLALETEGIAFREVAEGTGHVPGEGHAHIFLNGLKLGRAYADTVGIGALPAGDYRLRVVLNGHDHRPYLNAEGAPVEAVLAFSLP
jgi:hypothetical protein